MTVTKYWVYAVIVLSGVGAVTIGERLVVKVRKVSFTINTNPYGRDSIYKVTERLKLIESK